METKWTEERREEEDTKKREKQADLLPSNVLISTKLFVIVPSSTLSWALSKTISHRVPAALFLPPSSLLLPSSSPALSVLMAALLPCLHFGTNRHLSR